MAYSGIGNLWIQQSMRGYVPASEAHPQAKEALLRAVELDDSLAEVHVSLAIFSFTFEWDFSAAEKEFRRAIQLNRNSAEAHFFMGIS